MNRYLGWIIFALIVAAAALRVAGVYDDFWLDEIWSQRIAAHLQSAMQVFTHPLALSDNNHPLNTLLIRSLRNHPHWPIYRAPALVAGIATIVVTYLTLRRRGGLEALLGVVLVGFSYPLVQFSSEARGYALALFFAILAFDALDRHLARGGWGIIANLVFCVACTLGLLAHLTFVHFWFGAAAWSIYRWSSEETNGGWKRAILRSIRFHLAPLAVMVALYFGFVRRLTIGGAPVDESRLAAIRDAIGGLLGAGDSSLLALLLIVAAAGLFVVMLWTMWRRHRREAVWLFLLVTIIISPALVLSWQILFIEAKQPIAARYFLVPFIFYLIGLAMLLAHWLRRRGALRWTAGAIVGAFLAVNLWHTILFLRIGRANHLEALAYISERTPLPVITVLSDHPLRTSMVLHFYQQFLPPAQKLIVYEADAQPPADRPPAMWIIISSDQRGQVPGQFPGYEFEREFTYYGLSGYSWYVYRHVALPAEVK